MCKAIDDMMQDSREEGKAEGRTEGILFALTGLVRDGVLSIKDAALRANMTESAFEAAMKKIKTTQKGCTAVIFLIVTAIHPSLLL